MKKALLFIAALAVWLIGGSILMLLSDIYIHLAHPDGLTYGSFLLRELLFGLPDLMVLFGGYFVFGAALVISPYRRVIGGLLVASGVYFMWLSVTQPGVGNSMLMHVLINAWSIILGLTGLFGKQTKPSEPEPVIAAEPV